MNLALFEPDIPQNAGNMIRTSACLGVDVHIIEPCGFPFSTRAMRRAGMDYIDHASLIRHDSWEAFERWRRNMGGRLIVLSSKATHAYTNFDFATDDVLLVGRESAGVPGPVVAAADALLAIPMAPGLRSLNVATSAAMVLGEALRQCQLFPTTGLSSDDLA